MIRCKKCIMPEVDKHIFLDDKQICNVCNQKSQLEETSPYNLEEGLTVLKEKIERLRRGKSGKYDCAVGISGGKDSTMILYMAKYNLGLNPLAIFIDNGFALEEMYYNIHSVTNKMKIDLIIYKPKDIKDLLVYLLRSKKPIYYCRLCHQLLDVYVRDIALKNGINILLGGYTKGQEYAKNDELYWIFNCSDQNVNEELLKMPRFEEIAYILNNHAMYLYENYESIIQLNPFQFIKYDDKSIINFLTGEFDIRFPKNSWPADSTNCFFNYVSQYLALQFFGYSQHETELSTLVRTGEMSRERAFQLINTPIPMEFIEQALDKLGLKYEDVL